MLTKQMKLAVILTAAMSTGALAQTATVVETPDGQTAVLPAEAVESDGVSPVATAREADYPILNQDMNDQTIADTLLAQGFGDIYILRDGSLMTVTASRGGKDIKLLYNLVEGRLIEVNGERILTEKERTPDPSGDMQPASAAEPATDANPTDASPSDEAAGDADAAADDRAAEDGTTEGTEGGGTADSDPGTDSGSGRGSDAGTNG